MWYNGSHCTANQMEVDVVAPEIKKAVNKFSKKIGPTSILSLKCCVERLKRLCARRIKQITSRNNDEAIKMRREKKFQWAVVRISFGQTCCDFLRCDYFEALWAFFCDFYHTAMDGVEFFRWTAIGSTHRFDAPLATTLLHFPINFLFFNFFCDYFIEFSLISFAASDIDLRNQMRSIHRMESCSRNSNEITAHKNDV